MVQFPAHFSPQPRTTECFSFCVMTTIATGQDLGVRSHRHGGFLCHLHMHLFRFSESEVAKAREKGPCTLLNRCRNYKLFFSGFLPNITLFGLFKDAPGCSLLFMQCIIVNQKIKTMEVVNEHKCSPQ